MTDMLGNDSDDAGFSQTATKSKKVLLPSGGRDGPLCHPMGSCGPILHLLDVTKSCFKFTKTGSVGTIQHNQFMAGLSRFGPAGTPSRASYHQGVEQYKHDLAFP